MRKLYKYMFAIILLFIVCFARPDKAFADSAVIENLNDGTAKLQYNNDYDVKIKLLVQLTGGTQYKYDIPKGSVDINIPLTQGNGEYKFILCRNISGTKYAVIQTVSITQKLANDNDAYLSSNYIINWDKTNAAIKKAQSLVAGKSNENDKIKYIYEFVVKNYSYDFTKAKNIDDISKAAAYIPNIAKVYSEKKGICYDYSILMASMLRSVGVPTKVVTGYTPNAKVYHAWNNVYANSKWNVMDTTYDAQMYKAKTNYSMYKKFSDYKDVVYTY
nr:transglutaminase-like domain-containing protein [uncultured Catonella sp.]